MTLDKIESVLERLGYPLNYRGQNYIGTCALFRSSDNPVSLLCYPDNLWDQVEGKRWDWPHFVAHCKKISLKDAEEFLGGAEFEDGNQEEKEEKIKVEKALVESDYEGVKSYDFFLRRGISKEILDYYGAELCQGGGFYGRIIFKIRNEKGKLVGVTGRDALNRKEKYGESFNNWKHKGSKSDWVYPCFPRNLEAIKKTGQIVIVESIGDLLALNNSDIWNVLVNFGLSLSPSRISWLLRCNPNSIFLSLNDDKTSEVNRGQVASEKCREKLGSFFSKERVITAPPSKGDFGDMNREEIGEWAAKFGVKFYESM